MHAGDTASEQCIQPQAVSQRERLGVAVGSRAHLEERAISQRSWYRNLLMHGFHFMAQLVAGGTIKDTQCGFKVSLALLSPMDNTLCEEISLGGVRASMQQCINPLGLEHHSSKAFWDVH